MPLESNITDRVYDPTAPHISPWERPLVISGGWAHSTVLLSDKTLTTWGNNGGGS
jgi:hypothetical protein